MLILTLLPVVAAQGVPAPNGGAVRDPRCGAYCLYIALLGVGIPVESYEACERVLGEPSENGFSFDELQKGAEALGAHAIAVETSLDRLKWRRENFACIALLDNRHFVLLFDSDGRTVSVIDPPSKKELPAETFTHVWTKRALIISRESPQPEETLRAPLTWQSFTPAIAALAIASAGAIWVWRRRSKRARQTTARLAVALATSFVSLNSIAGCDGAPRDVIPTAIGRSRGSLQLEPEVHHLGDILGTEPGETRLVETTLRNTSEITLRIVELRTSCT